MLLITYDTNFKVSRMFYLMYTKSLIYIVKKLLFYKCLKYPPLNIKDENNFKLTQIPYV